MDNKNGTIFICSHSYHISCYNNKCIYCEEFYKCKIFENIKIFLKQIEKGSDTLTQKDIDDETNNIEKEGRQSEEIEIQDILNKLEIETNQIIN